MSAFALRLAAMAAMVLDHLGLCFAETLPSSVYVALRLIGRIAMPIFCFQIAEGLFYTRNALKYILRLSLFSLASEIPYNLMLSGELSYLPRQNVGFTLLAGLCAILLYDSFAAQNRKLLALVSVLALGLTASLFRTDYGMFGVYFVFIFYYFRKQPRRASLALAVGVALQMLEALCGGRSPSNTVILAFAFAAALPISLYNGEKGRGGKALQLALYCVYPLHMMTLYLLTLL